MFTVLYLGRNLCWGMVMVMMCARVMLFPCIPLIHFFFSSSSFLLSILVNRVHGNNSDRDMDAGDRESRIEKYDVLCLYAGR